MLSWAPFKLPRWRASARPAVVVGVLLLALPLAACGASKSKSATSQTTTTTPPPTATPTPAGGSATVTTGPVHGTLSGQDHAPKVNRAWRYSLEVTDVTGHPLSGTVDIEFMFGGQVVGRDTPPTHRVTEGRWHDTIEFPATAVGVALTFRAVVRTRLGSISLDWPVTVRR